MSICLEARFLLAKVKVLLVACRFVETGATQMISCLVVHWPHRVSAGSGRSGGSLARNVEFDLLSVDRGGGTEREQGEREGGLEFHFMGYGLR